MLITAAWHNSSSPLMNYPMLNPTLAWSCEWKWKWNWGLGTAVVIVVGYPRGRGSARKVWHSQMKWNALIWLNSTLDMRGGHFNWQTRQGKKSKKNSSSSSSRPRQEGAILGRIFWLPLPYTDFDKYSYRYRFEDWPSSLDMGITLLWAYPFENREKIHNCYWYFSVNKQKP